MSENTVYKNSASINNAPLYKMNGVDFGLILGQTELLNIETDIELIEDIKTSLLQTLTHSDFSQQLTFSCVSVHENTSLQQLLKEADQKVNYHSSDT